MTKKILLITLLLAILFTAACGTQTNVGSASPTPSTTKTETSASSGTSANDYSKELTIDALFVISKDRIPEENSLFDQMLKEKFNLVIDWQIIPGTNVQEKINLLYASGEEPEMVFGVGTTETIPQKLGMDGFLIPLNEHWDKLPNYRKLWLDDEWDTLLKFASNADGNLYYLPQKNYRAASQSWIYRKSAFDEMGLTFPKTVDELYSVLKAIKAKHPESIPMPNRDLYGMLLGVNNAFAIQVNSSLDPYIDPITGELVPFPADSDAFREVLKYFNKFYAEGLIDKEFATMTDQIWTERYANGLTYIEFSYSERAAWAEATSMGVDPDVDWEFVPENISNYQDFFMYNRELPHVISGPFFSKIVTEEKFNRLMALFDWLSTDEGTLFINMGKEGVTYEIVDGEPVFMSHMYDAVKNPNGKKEWQYGLYLFNVAQHPAYVKFSGKDANLALSEAFLSNPKARYFSFIPWQYTVEEEKQIADLNTVIKDITNEHILKFILGTLDPNDDKAWTDYKNTLEKAGLSKLIKLRTDAYARIKN